MRLWQNKISKKKFRVSEWWECPPSEEIADLDEVTGCMVEVLMSDGKTQKVKTKIGVLYQVGWLLENEHHVWFGLNMSATDQFKDLGPYKPKKKSKVK